MAVKKPVHSRTASEVTRAWTCFTTTLELKVMHPFAVAYHAVYVSLSIFIQSLCIILNLYFLNYNLTRAIWMK